MNIGANGIARHWYKSSFRSWCVRCVRYLGLYGSNFCNSGMQGERLQEGCLGRGRRSLDEGYLRMIMMMTEVSGEVSLMAGELELHFPISKT